MAIDEGCIEIIIDIVAEFWNHVISADVSAD